MNPRALVAVVLIGVGCRGSSEGAPDGGQAPSAAPLVDRAPPAELGRVRQFANRGSDRLVSAAKQLNSAVSAREPGSVRTASFALRSAYRRLEPVACVVAPIGSSQLDPSVDDDDSGERPTDVGLRVLGDLVQVEPVDWSALERVAGYAERSARLVKQEISVAHLDAQSVGFGLSRSAYAWGRRLDGSEARYPEELAADVQALGSALVELSDLLASAVPKAD